MSFCDIVLEKKIKKKENAEKDKKPNLIKAQTQVKHLEKAVKESKKKLEAVYQTL
jgi:CII-binding regulator of phage lambda lysogenization HflD